MEIRLFTMDDYDELYQLWLRTPGLGLNNVDDSREGIAKYLKRNPTTNFVAIKDQKLVGGILSGHDGRRGYISHTVVDGNEQRQGIATALVDAVIKAMKEEGIHKIYLVAFKRNEKAKAFWESYGFKIREDLDYRDKGIIDLKRIDT